MTHPEHSPVAHGQARIPASSRRQRPETLIASAKSAARQLLLSVVGCITISVSIVWSEWQYVAGTGGGGRDTETQSGRVGEGACETKRKRALRGQWRDRAKRNHSSMLQWRRPNPVLQGQWSFLTGCSGAVRGSRGRQNWGRFTLDPHRC